MTALPSIEAGLNALIGFSWAWVSFPDWTTANIGDGRLCPPSSPGQPTQCRLRNPGPGEGTGCPWEWRFRHARVTSHDYGVATAWPMVRPQVMPVWGAWFEKDLLVQLGLDRVRRATGRAYPWEVATTEHILTRSSSKADVTRGERMRRHRWPFTMWSTPSTRRLIVDFFAANCCYRLQASGHGSDSQGDFGRLADPMVVPRRVIVKVMRQEIRKVVFESGGIERDAVGMSDVVAWPACAV